MSLLTDRRAMFLLASSVHCVSENCHMHVWLAITLTYPAGMLMRPTRHEAKAEARQSEAEAENFFEAEATMIWRVPGQEVDQRKFGERL